MSKFLSNIDGAGFFVFGLGNFLHSYEQILPLVVIWKGYWRGDRIFLDLLGVWEGFFNNSISGGSRRVQEGCMNPGTGLWRPQRGLPAWYQNLSYISDRQAKTLFTRVIDKSKFSGQE